MLGAICYTEQMIWLLEAHRWSSLTQPQRFYDSVNLGSGPRRPEVEQITRLTIPI